MKILELLEDCEVETTAPKRWGYERWITNRHGLCIKILVLYPGYECSEHFHRDKYEVFLVLDGPVDVNLDGRLRRYERGELIEVQRYQIHSFRAVGGISALLEVSTEHREDDSYRKTTSHYYNLGGTPMEDILGIVGRFRKARILVIGDVMIDEWLEGKASRLSPEGPCPIVENPRLTRTPGGAANAAINITSLGASALCVGVVGEDGESEILKRELENAGARVAFVPDKSRPTTRKQRVMTGTHHHVRLDWGVILEVDSKIEEQVWGYVAACIEDRQYDAILISDYGKGVLTRFLVHSILDMAALVKPPVPVVIDPRHYNWDRYLAPGGGAAHTIKPNLRCLESLNARRLSTEKDILDCANKARERIAAASLVVTRGRDGLTVVNDQGYRHIPAHLAEVAEVSGAGDTIMAVLAICAALGIPTFEAAEIANTAGALVVNKAKTASVTPTELAKALQKEESDGRKETRSEEKQEDKGAGQEEAGGEEKENDAIP